MIRLAVLKDVTKLKELLIQLLVHHQEFSTIYGVDLDYQNDIEQFFVDILAQKNIHVFVAEIENVLVGFIICSKHKRPNYFAIKSKGRIDSLYVESSFRGKNLASQLVEKALENLHDENYIELEFTAKNQLANDFWLNKGFEILNHQCILTK
ncbi:GNAT family N-acetyltransferase [Empedobacter sedimenti]|uniref:GNAT family N-acetyltransferase n=1 Tax=Empedobacter sedimenti TaxID=3042610 RepID=UPI0024A75074|nr:GNAT family N-acetyltransferase [Empedobacter sedimenti]